MTEGSHSTAEHERPRSSSPSLGRKKIDPSFFLAEAAALFSLEEVDTTAEAWPLLLL